jgi:hypothetical protein
MGLTALMSDGCSTVVSSSSPYVTEALLAETVAQTGAGIASIVVPRALATGSRDAGDSAREVERLREHL